MLRTGTHSYSLCLVVWLGWRRPMVCSSLGFGSFQDVHTWRIWDMGHCGYQFLDHWGFLWNSGLSWWKYMALLRELCLMGDCYPNHDNRRPPTSSRTIQQSFYTLKALIFSTAGRFSDEWKGKVALPFDRRRTTRVEQARSHATIIDRSSGVSICTTLILDSIHCPHIYRASIWEAS